MQTVNLIMSCLPAEIRSSDLVDEMDKLNVQGIAFETGVVEFEDQAQHAEVLYVPSAGRAGITWGADAQWTDATGITDAANRFAADEMVE
jgi:hypothetical protein